MSKSPMNFQEVFENPDLAARYVDGPVKFVPGLDDIHHMVNILIREKVTEDAKILVHGAGGGLELEMLARRNPHWQFTGVDPAKPMLDVAAARLGTMMERVHLHHGYIDDAPDGPFDAATSLLTLHFLGADERRRTLSEIIRRLKPGAPVVAVHSCFPKSEAERKILLSRYAAFAVERGVEPDLAESARAAIDANLPALDPDENVETFHEAGLVNVSSFYAAFTWRGWVGYVPGIP